MSIRITKLPQDIALLNRALQSIEALELEVAALRAAQATRNQFSQTIEALAPTFNAPLVALLGAPVGRRWVVDVSPTGALGFYSDSDDAFVIDTDTRLYKGSIFRLKVQLNVDGEVDAGSYIP